MLDKLLKTIFYGLGCAFAGYGLAQPAQTFITGSGAYVWLIAVLVVAITGLFLVSLGDADWSKLQKWVDRQVE